MGGVNSSRAVASELFEVSQSKTCKRQRLSSISCEESPRLIPSLPDEISIQILARLPKICYLKMRLVSRAWKAAIVSAELFNVRKELGTTEAWLYILMKVEDEKFLWYALDPLSRRWQRLPTMPGVSFEDEPKKGLAALRMWNVVGSSIKIADTVMSWLRKKGTLDRLPFHGSAVGAIDGCLYVLGGLSKASAMRCVWRYNPILNAWSEMSPMSIGRAFSKTGILNNKLYVVGGVAKGRGGLTSLQSAEVFDPYTGMWSEIPSMPFSKAQVLPTAFLADLLKPIATGMASYRGRLFVAQSLYCWPFFVDVGGEIYDPELNAWNEMPTGMGEGWPVKQAGTKPSVTVEDELYALEPSSSLDSARIKVYDYRNDAWKVLLGDIPICDTSNSQSSYLLAGLLGKLHVITKDANNIIRVLQVDVRNHLASSSSSSALPFDNSCSEEAESAAKPETCLWRVIATKNASSADLVSCQTLDH
ncbi:F-box/kelch-repeat protein At1g22040 [Hevea brasiliensis]|uniref:F-box/kelch-repeat protein At1g22040 n=1 Tax=Hevea brasiliensis TaxID=3981 RepID=UPI0025CBCF21|nr:F-box/kelch-repeat protein At1g22040 [Hevea brasiliensis]XP_021670605.2 F-box/kelch-repeat protein At1g22040 [Hevea brasiliensis]XP_021670606.2 F-box/kelch-repeat protein At1g22040 [Hevea brasiliensis]